MLRKIKTRYFIYVFLAIAATFAISIFLNFYHSTRDNFNDKKLSTIELFYDFDFLIHLNSLHDQLLAHKAIVGASFNNPYSALLPSHALVRYFDAELDYWKVFDENKILTEKYFNAKRNGEDPSMDRGFVITYTEEENFINENQDYIIEVLEKYFKYSLTNYEQHLKKIKTHLLARYDFYFNLSEIIQNQQDNQKARAEIKRINLQNQQNIKKARAEVKRNNIESLKRNTKEIRRNLNYLYNQSNIEKDLKLEYYSLFLKYLDLEITTKQYISNLLNEVNESEYEIELINTLEDDANVNVNYKSYRESLLTSYNADIIKNHLLTHPLFTNEMDLTPKKINIQKLIMPGLKAKINLYDYIVLFIILFVVIIVFDFLITRLRFEKK